MELKDFVSESLVQIVQGVLDAQSKLSGTAARINPLIGNLHPHSSSGFSSFGWAEGEGSNPVFLVNFDVAVTAQEGQQTKGGIGVVAGVFALGSQGQSDKANSAISRIQFNVPVLLPLHKREKS